MKVKMDFITNSSSTSFTAWGISISSYGDEGNKDKQAVYKKYLQNKQMEGGSISISKSDPDEDMDDFDIKEEIYSMVKSPLDHHTDYDDDEIQIGMCPTEMEDHETLMLFKMRIARTIKEQLGIEVTEKDIDWQEYCGYDS